jgi:membrane protein
MVVRVERRIEAWIRKLPWRALGARLAEQQAANAAKAVAFDFFLALLPMLALGAWALASVLRTNAAALEAGRMLLEVTPREARELVDTHVRSFSQSGVAPVAALSSWWLGSSAFHTLIHTFQENFECQRRSYLSMRVLGLGLALLGVAIFPVGAALGLLLQAGTHGSLTYWIALGLGPLLSSGAVRWLLTLTFVVGSSAFFGLLYRISLRRPFVKRRVSLPGGLVASLIGTVASATFGYYVAHLASFSLLYGSLVAVVVLLLWLLLWSHALIIGAIVNVTLEDYARGKLAPQRPLSAESEVPPTQTPSPGAKSAGA